VAWLTGSAGVWALMALAVYGLYIAVETLAGRLLPLWPGATGAPLRIAVITRNHADQIEGFLRSVLRQIAHASGPGAPSLMLLDLDSTDDTPAILDRLARDGGMELVQVAPDQVSTCLATGGVTLVVDLREAADSRSLLNTLRRSFQ
jgi:hypothetical protein